MKMHIPDLTSEMIEYTPEEIRYRRRYGVWCWNGFLLTNAAFWGFVWWTLC